MSFIRQTKRTQKLIMGILNEKLGKYVQGRIRRHIDYEGRGGKTPWTKSIRAKLTGSTTLYDTGKMYDNIKWYRRRYGVVVGSTMKRALAHHKGYTVKPVRRKILRYELAGTTVFSKKSVVPKRPFYYITGQEQMKIKDIIVQELDTFLDIELKSIVKG